MSAVEKQVIFRLDSGFKMGLGHFMRCKALADELLALGIKSFFAVKHCHQREDFFPHAIIDLENESELIEQIKKSFYQAIIVDNYDITSIELEKLSKVANNLVLLDDECNRGYLFADVIFNPVSSADKLPYKKYAARAKKYLGPAYILMRSVFNQVDLLPYVQRKNIILTMGGSDMNQLTLLILKQIHQNFSALPLIVVTGASCKHHLQIEQFCSQFNINYRHNEKHMEQLFANAKLAISAAGSTVFELAKCGVPSVFTLIADNQQLAVQEHQQLGWCSFVDCRKEANIDRIIAAVTDSLSSDDLAYKSQLAISCVDGNGAKRAAQIISQLQ
ncbi:MAG: UDP-2,4-diacetamido-2,4,6-trideoxy-beta-L-altropyranose hydrolase [Pseudomonadota bacterium]